MVSVRNEESSSSCQEGEQGDCVILNTLDSAASSTTNPLFFTIPHSFEQLTYIPQQVYNATDKREEISHHLTRSCIFSLGERCSAGTGADSVTCGRFTLNCSGN